MREINIDKISPWKPFFKSRQNKLLTLHFPANRSSRFQNKDYDLLNGLELRRFGYEVYVDGLTRVLRICELAKSSREETALQPFTSFHFRMNNCSINLLDDGIQVSLNIMSPYHHVHFYVFELAFYCFFNLVYVYCLDT